jgi:hypothetical protein
VRELHAFNHDLMSRWDISRLVNLFLSREIVLLCTCLLMYQPKQTYVQDLMGAGRCQLIDHNTSPLPDRCSYEAG